MRYSTEQNCITDMRIRFWRGVHLIYQDVYGDFHCCMKFNEKSKCHMQLTCGFVELTLSLLTVISCSKMCSYMHIMNGIIC
jgi:hypothetical protein